MLLSLPVPTGSPSDGGDVVVYVKDMNQLSLPTAFYSGLVSVSMALSIILHFINSPNNSPLSHCSSSLISALLVLSTIYLFIKVSLRPDIILCSWLGLKHQLITCFLQTVTNWSIAFSFCCFLFHRLRQYSVALSLRSVCHRQWWDEVWHSLCVL